MSLLVIGLISFVGVLIAYLAIRPMQRRRKDYDAGAVSEYWLQQQRGDPMLAARGGHLLGSRSTMRVMPKATTKISSVSTTATAAASPTRPFENAFW